MAINILVATSKINRIQFYYINLQTFLAFLGSVLVVQVIHGFGFNFNEIISREGKHARMALERAEETLESPTFSTRLIA